MTPSDRALLTQNIHIMINVAATIEFTMPLEYSIPINIGGAMSNLELAKECKHLEIYTHVSTAYANSEKPSGSFVKEQIYDHPFDVMEYIQKIRNMPEDQKVKEEKKIIGSYPNTYTFTKSNAERILKATRGNVPILICRPSIIGCSAMEPAPGWIDSLAAAASYVHATGAGIANHMRARPDIIFDLIPVDYVVNGILIGTAHQANKNEIRVMHSTSS
jgi:hypothetical protein